MAVREALPHTFVSLSNGWLEYFLIFVTVFKNFAPDFLLTAIVVKVVDAVSKVAVFIFRIFLQDLLGKLVREMGELPSRSVVAATWHDLYLLVAGSPVFEVSSLN